MKILSIETSCDETSVSVVFNGRHILSNAVSSSIDLHKITGGVVPEIAARKQTEGIIPVLDKALKDSGTQLSDIDKIAVTYGPGLIGSLIVGIQTAKTLSYTLKKPLIPVNHLLAHIYANWLITDNKSLQEPEFPAVSLIVSGGHTDIILMENHHKITHLGGTIDDAAGECFDKAARILNLGYPGGPAVQEKASKFKGDKTSFRLPRPLIGRKDYDFSFSGLKTAVLEISKKKLYKNEEISFEFQNAICDVLVKKTVRAALNNEVKSLIIGGGVSANVELRRRFLEKSELINKKVKVFVPKTSLCTDNAAPIAAYAYYHQNPMSLDKIKPHPSLAIN